MKFNVNQQDFQQALNYCQGVIEKRSTLPILSNILLNAQSSNLTVTATDLDLIFIHQIKKLPLQKIFLHLNHKYIFYLSIHYFQKNILQHKFVFLISKRY